MSRNIATRKIFPSTEQDTVGLIDALPFPFLVVNPEDYSVTLANKAAGNGKTGGQTCYSLFFGQSEPCKNSETPCPIETIRQTGRPVRMEQLLKDADGNMKTVEISAYPVFGPDGRLLRIVKSCVDVTESRREKAAIANSEKMLRTILKTVGEGIVTIGTDSRITMVNRELCRVFGYSEEEIIGRPLSVLIPEKYRSTHEASLKQHLMTGETRILGRRIELEGLRKTGEIFPVELRVEEISEGAHRYFTGAIRDISDRKKAEETLVKSEETFRTLVQSINGYLYSIRYENGRAVPVYRSPQCKEITGYSAEEYDRNPYLWIDMVYEKDRKMVGKFFSDLEQLRATKPLEHRIVHKSGRIVWVLNFCTVQSKDDGEIDRMDGFIIDITDRKQMEESLNLKTRELGERLKELECLYSISKLVSEEKKTIEEIFKRTADIIPPAMQYPQSVCTRISLDDKIFTSGDFCETPWRIAADIKRRGGPPGRLEVFCCECRPIRDEGPFLREEKRLVESVAAQLGRIVDKKESENALVMAKEEAEKATRLKDRFVSLVSHDLKGPLTTIQGYLQLLSSGKFNRATRHTMLEEAAGSCDDMIKLISELLNLSRIKGGAIKPRGSFLDAKGLIDSVIAGCRPRAEKKELHLSNEITAGMRIFGDEQLLHEAFINLADNAVKFSHAGDKIRFFIPPGKSETIAVADSGIGIEPRRQEKLFKYEEKSSTRGTNGESGTGLGLPLVGEIVAAHGGEIRVESKPGKGTVFYLALPHVRPRVLIIDDEAAVAESIAATLKVLDADFVAAGNAAEALDRIGEAPFHLILLDILLPDMSGVDLLKKLRQRKDAEDIPVIVITGDPAFSMQGNIFGLGADDFIRKPFSSEELLPRVCRFIS